MNPTCYLPLWATKLLLWLHPVEPLEEVEGDLAKLFVYWYKAIPGIERVIYLILYYSENGLKVYNY